MGNLKVERLFATFYLAILLLGVCEAIGKSESI